MARPAIDPGPAAMIGRLQRHAGNRAVARILMRQDASGGMSLPQGASAPGTTGPDHSVATPGDTAQHNAIEDARKDFSQGKFREINWALASDEDRFDLLDKATDPSLLWVGPRDESAIERCWESFGGGFRAAVESHPHLWTRSVYRGADPESIAPMRGKAAVFKDDVLAIVARHLEANEDRIVAEMGEFGILPPFELLRAGSPARSTLEGPTGPPLTGPSVKDRLREQARLAKVVLDHKRSLAALRENRVGLDLRPFEPTNPTLGHEDIVLFDGMTSWQWVKSTWDRVTAEIALILNAWPALYAADVQGALEIYANQAYVATDPLESAQEVATGQGAMKTTLTNTLRNIAGVRDKVAEKSADALDFTPVHRTLWGGQVTAPSGETWSRSVMLPVLNDERELSDDIASAGRFAIEVALFVAMTAGVIGTMGGAAIAIGVAGAGALKAQDKADKLAAARGTAIAGDAELVTKEAVSAAAAEAEQAKLDLAITTVASVLSVGVEAAASRINPDQMRSASAVDGAGEAGATRTRLRARQVVGEVGLPGAPDPKDSPAFFNKLGKMTATSRKEALDQLLEEAKSAGVAIHSDADAEAYLDFAARAQGMPKDDLHACTLGGEVFVRPEHAGNVRVLREELIHTFQQAAGYGTGDVVKAEIEARWMIIKFRHTWSISNDEVREMLNEIRHMKVTGRY